jgi:hypothetical protein
MWECSTCTFHNAESKQICDMCSKSRDGPKAPEQQLAPPPVVRKEKSRSPTPPALGLKCDRCTLVNQPGARCCIGIGTGTGTALAGPAPSAIVLSGYSSNSDAFCGLLSNAFCGLLSNYYYYASIVVRRR